MATENNSRRGKKVAYVMASRVVLPERVVGARKCEDSRRKSLRLWQSAE